jgi:hypothetical protein
MYAGRLAQVVGPHCIKVALCCRNVQCCALVVVPRIDVNASRQEASQGLRQTDRQTDIKRLRACDRQTDTVLLYSEQCT